jgi:hypothetical protein
VFNIFKHPSLEEKKTKGNPDPGLTGVEIAQPAAETVNVLPAQSSVEAGEPAGSPAPTGPTTPPAAPQVEQPSRQAPPTPPKPERRNLVYTLLSNETRGGRFMRPLLRWLAAITGLFALGLLAGYILLYQPTQKQLDGALVKLNDLTQSVTQKEKTQLSNQMDRDQALKALQQSQDDLKKAASENDLLVVLSGVNSTRVALVNKDGQTAKILIDQTQTDLSRALSYINTQDKNQGDLLKTRLDLASKELISDPQAALADLDKLSVDLNDLRLKLFKK